MGERDPNGECYVRGFESSDLNSADRYRDCCVEEHSNVSHRYPSEHSEWPKGHPLLPCALGEDQGEAWGTGVCKPITDNQD